MKGIRGDVESSFMGDVARRSTFRGRDDGKGGGASVFNGRFGGVPGERMSLSKEEDAEKYCVLFDTQLATDSLGEET